MSRRKEAILTVCYGDRRIWDSRQKAEAYFLEGATFCEGSERERYIRVYEELKSGSNFCTDGE